MFKNEIKVSAYKRGEMDATDIVIWRPVDEEKVIVFREDDDGNWSWSEDRVSNDIRPSLRVPRYMVYGSKSGSVLQLLVDEINYQFKIKATEDKVQGGELQAVQEHLNDMRSLVFKSDFIEIQKGSPVAEEGNK